jgi:hypothetical protein
VYKTLIDTGVKYRSGSSKLNNRILMLIIQNIVKNRDAPDIQLAGYPAG